MQPPIGPRAEFWRLGVWQTGSLGQWCEKKDFGETVSKLSSTPAPCWASAPAPKQGSGADRHRVGDPTSPRRERLRSERRTLSQRDRRSTSQRCGASIGLVVRAAHPTELARLLGYVCTAFPVACANASLVSIMGDTCLSFPPCQPWAGSPNGGAWAPSQVVAQAVQASVLRRACTRGPPPYVAVTIYNVMDIAHLTKLSCANRWAEPAHKTD